MVNVDEKPPENKSLILIGFIIHFFDECKK